VGVHILKQTLRLVVGLHKEIANSEFLDRGYFALWVEIQLKLKFIAEDGELKIIIVVVFDTR
jgi:hypothetical protein